jgi:hypothetical protein
MSPSRPPTVSWVLVPFTALHCRKLDRNRGRQCYTTQRFEAKTYANDSEIGLLNGCVLMKLKALWIPLVFVPVMSAATITCTAGAISIPVFDPSSLSGAVGDYTLDCTGGTPVVPPNNVPRIDIVASMNVPILNTGGWILTDGLNITSGSLGAANQIDFVGVLFDPPGTGHVDFQVENILVNPSAELPGFQFKEHADITSNFSFSIVNTDQLVAVNAVPEPSFTLVFVGLGLGAMWLGRNGGKKKRGSCERDTGSCEVRNAQPSVAVFPLV